MYLSIAEQIQTIDKFKILRNNSAVGLDFEMLAYRVNVYYNCLMAEQCLRCFLYVR